MNSRQHGMTIIETLGALAIASALLLGVSSMIDASLDDAKGQQAALYQAQVTDAARRYIAANYSTLAAATTGGTTATITLAQLKGGSFLSSSFAAANGYGHAPCVLVRQPLAGKLDALVAGYGGRAIPDREVAAAAMLAGQGGGFISAAVPGTARGASWERDTTSYQGVSCGGAGAAVLTGAAAADGGHLVSSLYYDGPGQLSDGFVYRNAVPGRPELNQMNVPLQMGAVAVEDASDARCAGTGDSGKIAVDASGRVLSCQAGVWRRQGSRYWRDPVAAYADLPASGNETGDVRLVSSLGRAFSWSGSAWEALAVDQDGNLRVPDTLSANVVQLKQVVLQNSACTDNGAMARDSAGQTLSCQNGSWRSPRSTRLNTVVLQKGWDLTAADGPRNVVVTLASLSGPRPLYLSGYYTCHATGSAPVSASVDMLDASGATVAYAGGCLSQLDSAGIGVQNLGDMGLQKIPDNITHIQLSMAPGAAAGDRVHGTLIIYSE